METPTKTLGTNSILAYIWSLEKTTLQAVIVKSSEFTGIDLLVGQDLMKFSSKFFCNFSG
jgi:hypothetical protein